jgi:hypothetical protein
LSGTIGEWHLLFHIHWLIQLVEGQGDGGRSIGKKKVVDGEKAEQTYNNTKRQ